MSHPDYSNKARTMAKQQKIRAEKRGRSYPKATTFLYSALIILILFLSGCYQPVAKKIIIPKPENSNARWIILAQFIKSYTNTPTPVGDIAFELHYQDLLLKTNIEKIEK